jgi:hypothetical protein
MLNHDRHAERIASQVLFQLKKYSTAAKTHLLNNGEGNSAVCEVLEGSYVGGNIGHRPVGF